MEHTEHTHACRACFQAEAEMLHGAASTGHAVLTSKRARTCCAMSSLVTLTMISLHSASLTYTRQ